MKNSFWLKNNSDFKKVYSKGKSYANRNLVIYFYPNNEDINRIGISVSKKVGISVVRNRIKRLVRECYRLNEYKIKKGYDIIFIVRVNSKNATYYVINKALMHLCKKNNLLCDYND